MLQLIVAEKENGLQRYLLLHHIVTLFLRSAAQLRCLFKGNASMLLSNQGEAEAIPMQLSLGTRVTPHRHPTTSTGTPDHPHLHPHDTRQSFPQDQAPPGTSAPPWEPAPTHRIISMCRVQHLLRRQPPRPCPREAAGQQGTRHVLVIHSIHKVLERRRITQGLNPVADGLKLQQAPAEVMALAVCHQALAAALPRLPQLFG